jgi:mono/diheme cytochrome c family protein
MGLAVEGDDAPAAAPTVSANAPAVAGASAPAAKAPVPIPAAAAPPPKPPTPPWVEAAESRKKIPYWVMPVLLFLPIWLIMYVGTLEEPTRSEGVLYEGGLVYVEAGCSGCHGAGGGGGTGPAFTNGDVITTFSQAESQMAWVVHGTQGYLDAGLTTYGDTNKPMKGYNGSLMPAFGADLTSEELIAVVFYERVVLGGYEDETVLAEAVWAAIEAGDLELPEHFNEGVDGDFTAEIIDMLSSAREGVAGGEVAAG